MFNARIPTLAAAGLLLLSASLYAGDLSQYRQFHLNSSLPDVAQQAQMKLDQARTIHHRPETIQQLTWPAKYGDSVKEIRFSFYNGELFRMAVEYDRDNTLGLTADDMIETISTTYGKTVEPAGRVVSSPDYDTNKGADVLARWEDPSWSFNLVRFKYDSAFSLVALSKQLEAPALEVIEEALRLDVVEAPQRRMDARAAELEERRLQQEKARLSNRPGFRP